MNTAKKRLKTWKYEDIDSALLKWFKSKVNEGAIITGPILMSKADKFGHDLGYQDFRCTFGWLSCFKERHNIKFKSVQGEEKAVDLSLVHNCHQTSWQNILQNYQPSDIYNCDESSLFYKLLPHKTFTFKGERCAGGKLSKERITVLFCCNMDGSDKYPLLCLLNLKNQGCCDLAHRLQEQYQGVDDLHLFH